MKLDKPATFLRAFGEYCYLERGGDAAAGERVRLCKKFAWYETHLANMVVDFVESEAGEPIELKGYICLREEKYVDVALCPPQLQESMPFEDDWHSPLWYSQGLFEKAVSIETKVIAEGRWKKNWKSLFNDLREKREKPPCDYLLGCVYGYRCDRKRLTESAKRSFGDFADLDPSEEFTLDINGELFPSEEGVRIEYVARWPAKGQNDKDAGIEDGAVKLPGLRWNSATLDWSDHTYIFLVLLARA